MLSSVIEHLDSDASVWVMEGTRDDGLSVIMLSFVILEPGLERQF